MASKTSSRPPSRRTAPRAASPSVARREREKAETRNLILDAARTMFSRDGYEATTMRGIADRIGYTATAIYHHFRDKNALMLELCAVDFRALGSALRSIGRIADPLERIRRMGLAYVRFAEEYPEQFRFMFMTARPPISYAETRLEPSENGYEFLLQAVREGVDAGLFREEFSDPERVAHILWAGVHGLATIQVHMHDVQHSSVTLKPAQEMVGQCCEALLHGMLPSS